MISIRSTMLGLTGLAATAWLSVSIAGQAPATSAMSGHDMPMASSGQKPMAMAMKMTTPQKIANALKAAPPAVGGKAAVLDWPDRDGEKPVTLRAGSNGWTCLPDMPATEGDDPMCVDEPWMQWFDAYLAKKAPMISRVGIGYMMASGGAYGSNSDPYAMTKTNDNHWGHHPPHLMIIVPDTKTLAGMSTDPNNGGPYVMFSGTPYAHIMAPITGSMMAMK